MESSIRSRIFAPDGNCSPYLSHYYLTGIFTQLPVVSLTRIRYLLATAKINQEQQCAQLTPSPGIFLHQKYFFKPPGYTPSAWVRERPPALSTSEDVPVSELSSLGARRDGLPLPELRSQLTSKSPPVSSTRIRSFLTSAA